MAVDKQKLLAPRLDEEEYEVEGVGPIVIRALSRLEVLKVQKVIASNKGTAAKEQALLSLAIVEPKLTEADVAKWQNNSKPGLIEPITVRIMELSGMTVGSDKAVYKEFEASPDADFRDVPSGQAGDDGQADASGDATG
jgi:hypothetical protein